MRTFKYKTLRGFLRNMDSRYFTFGEFVSGRFLHKTKGFHRFELSDEARDEAARIFASVIYSRPSAENVEAVRDYRGNEYGIFRRLWIRKDLRPDYCAGQDYDGEIRCIRRLIRTW